MCQYKGTKPPFVKNLLEFTESCYVMVDPFSPKRFCVNCAQFNVNEFPKDVQSRIVKMADNF